MRLLHAKTHTPDSINYLTPMVVLLVGVILTILVGQVVRKHEHDKANIEFEQLFNQTIDTIQHRMKANTQVLRAAEGLFSANQQSGREVSRSEFKAYVASLKLNERYPGIQGVGFSKLIRPEQLNNHLRTIRAEGFSDYALRPSGARNLYSSIIYLEPFDWRNQRAFGYDMYSEPVRQRAMDRARKTGGEALSGRVVLVQETEKEVQPGVLLYLPIYRGGDTPSSEVQRLNELVGWAYSPLRMKDLMSNLIERDLPSIKGQLAFSIYDGENANPASLLFSTEDAGSDLASPFHTSKQLVIAGQPWFLTAYALPGLHGKEDIEKTWLVFAIGLSISLFLAIIYWTQLRNAARLTVLTDRLRGANDRLSLAQRDSHAGFWDWDISSGKLNWTPEFFLLFGLDPATTEANFDTWRSALHPEDLQAAESNIADAMRNHTNLHNEYRVVWPTGEVRWIYASGNTSYDELGQPLRMTGICIDITNRKIAEEILLTYASVFNISQEAIIITSAENLITDVNPAFTKITGYTKAEVLGKNPNIISSGRQDKGFYESMWDSLQRNKSWRGEIWNRKKSGEEYAELLSISAICDEAGKVVRYVAVFSDITCIKEHEAELTHAAHFDALTGIPNRILLADRMRQNFAQASREKNKIAVCYLDLDGFKPINDKMGHAAGDEVLIEVARRIEHTIRGGDTVARLGGDEFVVLLRLTQGEDCVPSLNRLLDAIAQPISIQNQICNISASIGVSIYPTHEDDPDALLRHADQAMYEAKLNGKSGYHIWGA